MLNQQRKAQEEEYKLKCSYYDNLIFKYFDTNDERIGNTSYKGNVFKATKVVTQRVEYNIGAILKYIPKYIQEKILSKKVVIKDYKAFVDYLKSINANPKIIKQFLTCEYDLNKKELEQLYETGVVDYEDIRKCATIIEGNPYIRFAMMEEKQDE